MTKITDLPRDMLEEVLFRVPVTSSLRGFRSACKAFNTFCKDRRFITKHLAHQAKAATKDEFLAIVIMDFTVSLMSINLKGIRLDDEDDNAESSMEPKGTLVSLNDADQVVVSTVFHCDGLVLCVTEDISSRLVVWNPYLGQTRWIKPRNAYSKWDKYGFGYVEKSRDHKILRFNGDGEFEMYSFRTNLWRVLNVDADWFIESDQQGVTLKGNTYWYAREKYPLMEVDDEEEEEEEEDEDLVYDLDDFLICFDFTEERFRRHVLPFHAFSVEDVTLSSVGDEQLAILLQRDDETSRMEIWITTKINPEEVSWSKFLAVDNQTFMSGYRVRSFFFDQERKIAVVFHKERDVGNPLRNIAHIIGEDGYHREVDLGESTEECQCPRGCFYVPSSLQIKQGGGTRKRKRCSVQ